MSKNILLYRASAGSGKTFTLVYEYLKSALIQPQRYKNILAITFTNKATAEMKERIIRYLRLLGNGEATDMLPLLKENLPKHINIEKSATELLTFILHDYSNFSVMTIDSFFSMLLKSFAYELQLPPDMNILLHQQTALEYSVEQVLADYTSNKFTGQWLLEFVETKMSDGKKWKIQQDIKALARELLKNNLSFADERDDEYLRMLIKHCHEVISTYDYTLANLAEECLVAIYNSGYTDCFNKNLISFLKKIKDKNIDINATITKIIQGEVPVLKMADKNSKQGAIAIWHSHIQSIFFSIIDFYNKYSKAYHTAILIKKNFYSYILLRDIHTKLQEFRSKEDLILIHDINILISQLVKTDSVPFIYEKAGIRYDTILIDEFQDTSDVQWQNMLPLLWELLAKGGDKILVVGDAKQSIYRWRGGNLDLIQQNVYSDLLPYSEKQLSDLSLDTNYRSHEAIIDFNNLIFTHAIEFLPPYSGKINQVYAQPSQRCKPSHRNKGWVTIDFFTSWKNKNNLDLDERAALQKEHRDLIIQHITEAIEDGYTYGDMAILLKKNSEATELANFLKSQRIPVISSDALLFAENPLISGLIAACYYIQQPHEALYYYSFLKKIVDIMQLPYTVQELIFREEIRKQILSVGSLPSLQFMPLYDVFLYLLKHIFTIGIDDMTAQFLDIIQQRRIKSIEDFFQFWDDEGHTLSANSSRSNAIQILTIHKSKGLEFPIVILPNLEWKFNELSSYNKKTFLWLSTDEEPYARLKSYPVEYLSILEDSIYQEDYSVEAEARQLDVLNTLYVALTRAAHRLHLLLPHQEKLGEIKSANTLIYAILKEYNIVTSGITYNAGQRMPKPFEEDIDEEWEISLSFPKIQSSYFYKPYPYQDDTTLKGEILHAILSQIHRSENLHSIITKILLQYHLDTNDSYQYLGIIKNLTHTSQWQEWISKYKDIEVERELIWKNKILRPDLYFISDSDITLVDYKTGIPSNSHHTQIKEYANALFDIYKKNIYSYIIYIFPDIHIIKIAN